MMCTRANNCSAGVSNSKWLKSSSTRNSPNSESSPEESPRPLPLLLLRPLPLRSRLLLPLRSRLRSRLLPLRTSGVVLELLALRCRALRCFSACCCRRDDCCFASGDGLAADLICSTCFTTASFRNGSLPCFARKYRVSKLPHFSSSSLKLDSPQRSWYALHFTTDSCWQHTAFRVTSRLVLAGSCHSRGSSKYCRPPPPALDPPNAVAVPAGYFFSRCTSCQPTRRKHSPS
mmetsp:Transcript_86595/g.173274  ORF Transcript_86595/g.173274 Transcript_86595/m.173274 type:complete len:232 (-) Transcript_86595:162-857(-)